MNVDKFTTYLREAGAEILAPTNEYEVIRFRTINGVSVVYQGKRGYTFTGEAKEAFQRFEKKNIWNIQGRPDKKKNETLLALIERDDGTDCFFCGIPTYAGENQTIEHFLPVADGGNNNLKNLCIACKSCNLAVGNMPIVDKIKFIFDKIREELKHG